MRGACPRAGSGILLVDCRRQLVRLADSRLSGFRHVLDGLNGDAHLGCPAWANESGLGQLSVTCGAADERQHLRKDVAELSTPQESTSPPALSRASHKGSAARRRSSAVSTSTPRAARTPVITSVRELAGKSSKGSASSQEP
jgi:hypothetical protein